MRWIPTLCAVLAAAVALAADDALDPRVEEVRTLTAAARKSPDDLKLRLRLAEATLAARDFDAADDAFRAVLQKSPDDAEAMHGRARCARAQGRFREANQFARRAVDVGGDRSTASEWTTLLDVLACEGTDSDVARALDESMSLPRERQSGLLFNVAAVLAYDRGQLVRANEISAVGCERFSSSPWAWSARSWLLGIQGRDEEAGAVRARLTGILRDVGVQPTQRTQLSLPIAARCRVLQGPLGGFSHTSLRNRHAWDLQPIDEKGDAYKGKGEQNEDHVGWDMPVLAAADGLVVAVRDGVPDHEPGKPDSVNSAGNYVFIDHTAGEVTRYLHLRQRSVAVKVGMRVRRGDPIGRIGDSGWTTKPHLCFAVVTELPPEDATRPAVLARYTRIRRWAPLEVIDGCPDTDEWIEPPPTRAPR